MIVHVTVIIILLLPYYASLMKLQKFGAKSATADNYFGLIGPRECSAALGGPATSTEDLRHHVAMATLVS